MPILMAVNAAWEQPQLNQLMEWAIGQREVEHDWWGGYKRSKSTPCFYSGACISVGYCVRSIYGILTKPWSVWRVEIGWVKRRKGRRNCVPKALPATLSLPMTAHLPLNQSEPLAIIPLLTHTSQSPARISQLPVFSQLRFAMLGYFRKGRYVGFF